ncbi:MAG: HAD hydrolase family protein [Deltaproteobacteria bacterium]|jgi:soluble P-type ATPase|nr:HAD hydrolase family protein [Deltaproteobacteria bacterium]
MLTVDVPGRGTLGLEYLVLDYNGTLSLDGRLLPGVAGALAGLSAALRIHVLTADTFGLAAEGLSGLPVGLTVMPPGNQAAGKLAFVTALGPSAVCAIGNGLNDAPMLSAAALGVAVIGPEGAGQKTLMAADVVCPDISSALSLLSNPLRLVATLRD